MTNVSYVNPKDVHPVKGYTHVVSVENPGKILYISGQVSKNQKGEIVGRGDVEAQTRQVYRNLSIILESMGATFDDVVKQNIYTTRPKEIEKIRAVRTEILGSGRPPASTLVAVAALVDPDWLVEVEMVAVLRRKR